MVPSVRNVYHEKTLRCVPRNTTHQPLTQPLRRKSNSDPNLAMAEKKKWGHCAEWLKINDVSEAEFASILAHRWQIMRALCRVHEPSCLGDYCCALSNSVRNITACSTQGLSSIQTTCPSLMCPLTPQCLLSLIHSVSSQAY
jgi:hypothetical protein